MKIAQGGQNLHIDESGDMLRIGVAHAPHPLQLVRDVFATIVLLFMSLSFATDLVSFGAQGSFQLLLDVMLFAIVTAGAASVIADLLWQIRGQELLEVSSQQISIRHRVLGIEFARKFGANWIDAVFVSRDMPAAYLVYQGFGMGFLDFKGGKVAINTGKNLLGVVTHRFGTSLLTHEANEIVAMIHKRFPQYRYHPTHRWTYARS